MQALQELQELQGLGLRQAKVQVIQMVLEIARAVQILPRPLGGHRLTQRQHSSLMLFDVFFDVL